MNINLIYVGVDAIAIVLLLLVAVRFIHEVPGTRIAWFTTALTICVMCYVVSSRQDYGPLIEEPFRADFNVWHPLMNLLRNSSTAFFAFLCHSIFRDNRPIPRALFALLALQLFLEEPLEWILGTRWAVPGVITLVYEVVPSLIQIVFGGLALYWMLNERDADLDPIRRKTRIFLGVMYCCLLYTSPSPRDATLSRMPSSA